MMNEHGFAGFDHIDLRVHDLAAARPLYDALLPALGLTDIHETDGAIKYYEPRRIDAPTRFFGLNGSPGHRGDASRIAFTARSAADVDRLASIATAAGAKNVEGPEIPYSLEQYYAAFFEDASGNKLEICYRRRHQDAVEDDVAMNGD